MNNTTKSHSKTCQGCGGTHDLAHFGKNKTSKDGYQSRCKTCFKQYKTKKKLIERSDFDGEYKMKRYSKEEVMQHVQHLKQRESNPITASRFDYSFLFTNPKFNNEI
jgi:hypothetical protein